MTKKKEKKGLVSRPEVIAFLRDIKDKPEDDTPRLILADWLDDRGDPRGTFLRLQVMISQLTKDKSSRIKLENEANTISERFGNLWLNQLKNYGKQYHRRGLVQLYINAHLLYRQPFAILKSTETWEWVEHISLERITADTLIRLGSSTLLPSVAHLRLNEIDCQINSDHLASFFNSAALGGIRSLSFGRVEDLPATIFTRTMAFASALRGLTKLDIGAIRPDAQAVTDLCTSFNLANLQVLDLGNRNSALDPLPVGKEGVRAIADSPFLGRLRRLVLSGASIHNDAVSLLAASPHLEHITELDISHNWIDAEGVETFVNSPHAHRLRVLNLSNNLVGPRGVEAIASSSCIRDLEILHLENCSIGGRGAHALAKSIHLPALRQVFVERDEIPTDAYNALRERYPMEED